MAIIGIIAVVIMWIFILSLIMKGSAKTIISVFFVVSIFLLSYGISWIVVCGIVKLLSICFGFAFTWQLATGIWIVLCLLRWVISAAKPNEK